MESSGLARQGVGIDGGVVPSPPEGGQRLTTFLFEPTKIPDVVVITPRGFEDQRGRVHQVFRASPFAAHGLPSHFPQANASYSHPGVLRGIHYQKHPRAQGKLVTTLEGAIFDVAVDLRRASPTYGEWVGIELDSRRPQMLYIPPGFGHGFCTLNGHAIVLYQMSDEYAPELDGGIAWDDPDLGIDWPVERPVLSERDARLPRLHDVDPGF